MAKVYELPLTRNYVAAWGMKEAISEFVQNALDSESPFLYEYNMVNQTLRITSQFAALPPASLLLGMTSKADNESQIGNFGEGYKIAMLVLTRLNHKVMIYNDGVVWEPYFDISRQFDHETLHVKETKANKLQPRTGLTFEIHDIFHDDMVEIRKTCLQMQTGVEIGEFITTPFGQIMNSEQKKGHIYVGGLYITNHDDLKYGYNFNPDQIVLERDRQTINGWDLYVATQKMWCATEGHMDEIIQMIEDGDNDMAYARYNLPQIVKEAVWAAFKEKNPNDLPVGSRQELDALVKRGINNVVYVNDSHSYILSSDPDIKGRMEVELHQPAPVETLNAFYESLDCKLLTEGDKQKWADLLVKAALWRVK
jgi:hypothetical protein